MTDSAKSPPDPTLEREKLVDRLMEHQEISREEAEKLVEAHLQDRSSEIDPKLLDGIDLG